MKTSRGPLSLLALLSILVASGCGASTIHVGRGMPDVERVWRESPAVARQSGEIVLNLHLPEAASCTVEVDEANRMRCQAIAAETPAAAQDYVARQRRAGQATQGYLFSGYEATIAEIVGHRFRERFRQVTVLVNEANPPASAVDLHVDFALNGSIGPNREASVTLRAVSPRGHQLEASGGALRRPTMGWLAWSVPVAFIFFPVGLAAIPAGAEAMRRRISAESLALAFDDSARQLAGLVAARIASNHSKSRAALQPRWAGRLDPAR